MTEKIGRGSLTGNVLRGMTGSAGKERDKDKEQPGLIPMSLFAAWDADRTPPNCVPRYFIFHSVIVAAVSQVNLRTHRWKGILATISSISSCFPHFYLSRKKVDKNPVKEMPSIRGICFKRLRTQCVWQLVKFVNQGMIHWGAENLFTITCACHFFFEACQNDTQVITSSWHRQLGPPCRGDIKTTHVTAAK